MKQIGEIININGVSYENKNRAELLLMLEKETCLLCGNNLDISIDEYIRSIESKKAWNLPNDWYCKECEITVREDAQKAFEEEKIKEEQLDMQKARIDSDASNIEAINDGIPRMYHSCKPLLQDKRMLEKNVIIFGNFGTGKTYSGYEYMKYKRIRLESLFYIDKYTKSYKPNVLIAKRAFAIMKEMKEAISKNKTDEVFKKYTTASLLIIDEYGKNQETDYEASNLYEIINTRHENLSQTIIIVNANNKEELIKLIRPDVLDRFRGGIIEMSGKSRR